MKDAFDTALGIIGDVRVLLFIAFGSAALLYFPASLTPPRAASVIEQHRGWIWAAFVIGLSGLAPATAPCIMDLIAAGASLVAAPGRDRALLELAIRVAAEAGLPG